METVFRSGGNTAHYPLASAEEINEQRAKAEERPPAWSALKRNAQEMREGAGEVLLFWWRQS